MLNTPIEVLEMSFPLRVEEYALVPDSGGAGTWRGGLGVRRSWRVLETRRQGAACFERQVTPPFGLAGGQAGAARGSTWTCRTARAGRCRARARFTAPAGRWW